MSNAWGIDPKEFEKFNSAVLNSCTAMGDVSERAMKNAARIYGKFLAKRDPKAQLKIQLFEAEILLEQLEANNQIREKFYTLWQTKNYTAAKKWLSENTQKNVDRAEVVKWELIGERLFRKAEVNGGVEKLTL